MGSALCLSYIVAALPTRQPPAHIQVTLVGIRFIFYHHFDSYRWPYFARLLWLLLLGRGWWFDAVKQESTGASKMKALPIVAYPNAMADLMNVNRVKWQKRD